MVRHRRHEPRPDPDTRPRCCPTARVLVAGGRNRPIHGDASTSSAELYDPGTGTWTQTGSMHGPRGGHTATAASDGSVLVSGGSFGVAAREPVSHAPSCTTRAAGLGLPPRICSRARHWSHRHAAPMARCSSWAAPTATHSAAELYDPGSGTWTATGYRSHVDAWIHGHPVARWQGARGGRPRPRRSAHGELYDPSSGSWTRHRGPGPDPLGEHCDALAMGRCSWRAAPTSHGGSKTTASAEVYDPSSGSLTAAGNMLKTRFGGCTARCCPTAGCSLSVASTRRPRCGLGGGVRPGHANLDGRREPGLGACRSDSHAAAGWQGARDRRAMAARPWRPRSCTTRAVETE